MVEAPARPPAPGPNTVLRGHEGDVQCLQFISNSILAAGDAHGIVKLWSLDTLRPALSTRLHPPLAGVISLQMLTCPDGKRLLLSAGRDGCVKSWQLADSGDLSSSPLLEVRSDKHSFCRPHACWRTPQPAAATAAAAAAAAPTSQEQPQQQRQGTAVSGGSPELQAGLAARRPPGPGLGRLGEAFAAGAVGAAPPTHRPGAHPGCPDPECVASAQAAAAAAPESPAQREAAAAPGAAALAAGDGWYLACAGENTGELCVWDVRAGGTSCRSFRQEPQAAGKLGMCMALRTMPGSGGGGMAGMRILSGFEDGSVVLWDERSSCTPLAQTRGHSEPVLCLAVAPGSDLPTSNAGSPPEALSGAADSQICCWSLPSSAASESLLGSGEGGGGLKMTRALPLAAAGVSDVAYRADGRVLASAGWDGKVRLFSGRKKQALAVLRYHQKEVTCVRFAPPGAAIAGADNGGQSVFASASRDKTVACWAV